MDSCAEAARARDEFDQLQISFSPSGFLYLIPTLHVRTRTTGPQAKPRRDLTTPPPSKLCQDCERKVAWLRRAKPKFAFALIAAIAGALLLDSWPSACARQARLLPQSHFESRLFKKTISAELTSSAFSCCVQCPQSGNIIVCSSLGTNCLRLAISWSIPGNFTTRSRFPAM